MRTIIVLPTISGRAGGCSSAERHRITSNLSGRLSACLDRGRQLGQEFRIAGQQPWPDRCRRGRASTLRSTFCVIHSLQSVRRSTLALSSNVMCGVELSHGVDHGPADADDADSGNAAFAGCRRPVADHRAFASRGNSCRSSRGWQQARAGKRRASEGEPRQPVHERQLVLVLTDADGGVADGFQRLHGGFVLEQRLGVEAAVLAGDEVAEVERDDRPTALAQLGDEVVAALEAAELRRRAAAEFQVTVLLPGQDDGQVRVCGRPASP